LFRLYLGCPRPVIADAMRKDALDLSAMRKSWSS
jgi:hypothetical protein